MADSGFAFSALVAIDGRIIVQDGHGWIDSRKTRRTTDRTLFNIASITKSFTSIAIFLLRDNHLLSLADTLPKFFTNVPNDKRAITLTHLLTHTSGLDQNYVADGIAERDSAVKAILNDTLKFAPGTGFSYSNENYTLLGAIIEVVTHQLYEDAIRRLVFREANMTDSRFWGEITGMDQIGVAENRTELDSSTLSRNWGFIGSIGMYSNVVELHRWLSTLIDGRLLKPMSLEQMWTVKWQLEETGIASGWFVTSSGVGREIWTRGTEDWGHNGVVRWFPENNVTIIVLSNSGERGDKNTTANRFISDRIVKMIFE